MTSSTRPSRPPGRRSRRWASLRTRPKRRAPSSTPSGSAPRCSIRPISTSVIPSVARRIGFIRLPIKEDPRGRDDDDTDDGHDRGHHPKWHNSEPGDEDADGVEDRYDTNTSRENTSMFDPLSLPGQQGIDYPLTVRLVHARVDRVGRSGPDRDDRPSTSTTRSACCRRRQARCSGTALCTLPLLLAGTYTARIRNLGSDLGDRYADVCDSRLDRAATVRARRRKKAGLERVLGPAFLMYVDRRVLLNHRVGQRERALDARRVALVDRRGDRAADVGALAADQRQRQLLIGATAAGAKGKAYRPAGCRRRPSTASGPCSSSESETTVGNRGDAAVDRVVDGEGEAS